MKIYLRMNKDEKDKTKCVDNTLLIPKESKVITVMTLPPFLKDPKCGCGKPAEFILGDMTFTCCGCIGKGIVGSNVFMKKEDVSIPLTRVTITKMKFEWSINQNRWYTIYGRAFKPKDWDKFLAKLKGIILSGTMAIPDADYDKDKKEMTIY